MPMMYWLGHYYATFIQNGHYSQSERTRDEKIIQEADIVFDVGGIYDPNSRTI